MKNKFNELNILEETKKALEFYEIETMTEIQKLSIPKMLNGDDFIANAQTGTGKTYAFLIPMIEQINPNESQTQGLILAPTRELAMQVYKETIKLIKFNTPIKATLIVGGESYDKQFRELNKNPHIIVATPGRIIDHLNRKRVNLSNVKTLTIDEADEMLQMGFLKELEEILRKLPKEKQTVLFSATMPNEIKRVANTYLKTSDIIKTDAKSLTTENVRQHYYIVKRDDKLKLLIRFLDYHNPKSLIIFCNTKADVDRITSYLKENGYNADSIHGDLNQNMRTNVMNSFKNHSLNILIATDVAARGIDISNLEMVLNYDIPHQDEIYIHRIGRTGRASNKGNAYSFITPNKRRRVNILERYSKSKIEKLDIPTIKEIEEKVFVSFEKDLKQIIERNDKTPNNYLKYVNEYLKDDASKNILINALIHEIIPTNKTYPDIFEQNNQSKRNNNRNQSNNKNQGNNNRRGRNAQDTTFKINLGKRDKVTPITLFKLLEFNYKVFKRDIGKIKILRNETVFEIKANSMHKFNYKKTLKSKNQVIKIEKV